MYRFRNAIKEWLGGMCLFRNICANVTKKAHPQFAQILFYFRQKYGTKGSNDGMSKK